MSVVAGIDLGTTSVRVGLFESDGSIRASAQAPLGSAFPSPGRVEQDPDLLFSIPLDLLRRALDEADLPASEVAAIGLACQRATFLGWSARTGAALTPAIGWQDNRTQVRVDQLRREGIPVTTLASCTKMEWLLAEIPAARSAHERGDLLVGTIDSWLTWKLTEGQAFITDPSNASATGLYDLRRGDWSAPALDLFHIDRSVLPEVTTTAATVGTTASALLGHPIPVASRAGDQQAACFAHQISEGEAKLTLGTSAMLDVANGTTPGPVPVGAHILPLWRLEAHGEQTEPSCVEGSIPTAGAAVEWLVRMGLLGAIDQLDPIASRGSGLVTMVPALAGLGTPHDVSAARASFSGISLDTEPADLVLGVLDGLAHRCAELADALGVDENLPVDGGLSRSRVFLRRLADATGRNIIAARDPETTLLGAARLAAVAIGDDNFSPVVSHRAIEPSTSSDERESRRSDFAAAVSAASIGIASPVDS